MYDLTDAELDEKLKTLQNEMNITEARKKEEKRFQEMDTATYEYLRIRCKEDLFFLTYAILGYSRLSPNLHGHLCAWMQRNQEERFRCILLPRGHFKSTVVTISHSLQIVLPDATKVMPWPYNLGTNCRLLICHETDSQASNFLFAITSHILSNSLLMGLFPEIIPSPRTHRINRHELELPREQTWPEPTIDTMGVGGKSQGRHYNYIKCDDLIGDKARDSEVMMNGAKEWFDNIQSFFSVFKDDHLDLIGTRWAFDDLYAHAFHIYEDVLLKYIRGVEESDEEGIKQTIFPEEFSRESLDILRKNPKVYAAQYANDPDAGATEFDKSWKRYYHWIVPDRQIAVFSGKVQTRIHVKDLDICILIDPAMTGLAGLTITGTDNLNRVFVLKTMQEIWRPSELCDLVFKLAAQWKPRLVAIEEVLFSGIFKIWFEREMSYRQQYFSIVPVSPEVGGRAQSKPMRVRQLTNYFSAGRIYFDPKDEVINTQFDRFGAIAHYHALDALAYGPHVWRPALQRTQMDKYKQAEDELLSSRDVETGYSKIRLSTGD